jgi:replication factor A1
MHKTKDELYEIIKDFKTKKEFDEEIKKKSKKFDQLLDEDTIALLIVDQLGKNTHNVSRIKDVTPGIETTVFGKITDIGTSRHFTRKNGSSGKVVNLEITDDTGSCSLVLWNKDVDLVKNNMIKKGTSVKVINGYTKDGFNGLEINIGRWSLIDVESDDMPTIKAEKKDTDSRKSVMGTLIYKEPTRAFFRDNGEFGFVTNIKIKIEDGKLLDVTLWDKIVKELQNFKNGDLLEIKNMDIRVKNGKTERHVNGKGIIKKL